MQLAFYVSMQVIQTVGILYVLFVRIVKGATSRKGLYVYASITLVIFVGIPVINFIFICGFLIKFDFSTFSYWFICYGLVGLGMIAWFFILIFGNYVNALEAVDKEIKNPKPRISYKGQERDNGCGELRVGTSLEL